MEMAKEEEHQREQWCLTSLPKLLRFVPDLIMLILLLWLVHYSPPLI